MKNELLGKCGMICRSGKLRCHTVGLHRRRLPGLYQRGVRRLYGGAYGGDCFSRGCILGKGLDSCGRCGRFPCEGLLHKPHSTVPDKEWLLWKRGSKIEG